MAARLRSAGFTLIELMIGVVIGLLATLAITQVMVNSEGQKRTTTSGSDAQVNGALALATLQRSIMPAGYGFAASQTSLGCTLTAKISGAVNTNFPPVLAPIVIKQGASGAPDTIRVFASGKTSFSVPLQIVSPGYNPGSGTLNQGFPVAGVSGVAAGDLMITLVDSSQPCEMFQVSTPYPNTAMANNVVPRTDDGYWNTAGNPSATYGDGNLLLNMGAPMDVTYSVNTGSSTLQVTSLNLGTNSVPSYSAATDLFANIVSLKALYGKDTDGDNVVDTWDATTPTTNTEWKQVKAVRVAVVARSSQYEKDPVTTSNPSWIVGTAVTITGTAACGSNKCLTLKVDTPADWQHYRYKVFETVIPLRNMIWNS